MFTPRNNLLLLICSGVLIASSTTSTSSTTVTSLFSGIEDLHSEAALVSEVVRGWPANWQESYLEGHEPVLRPPNNSLELVNYYLWTPSNPSTRYLIQPFNTSSVSNSNLNVSLTTHFLYHGFGNNGMADYIIDIKNALLSTSDVNVISVDYELLADLPNYPRAVFNTYRVANLTAAFIMWLKKDFGLDLGTVHVTGHSLGGQAAGITGNYAGEKTLGRVTGLDPAGPLFDTRPDNLTISPKSGEYVDIIHTNGCFLLDGCYGTSKPVGVADFYPNGGQHQPACVNDTFGPIMDLIADCSHHRAPLYWIESIYATAPQNKTFKAEKCSDWDNYRNGKCSNCRNGCANMGLPAKGDGASGIYYLNTALHSPYALGAALRYTPSPLVTIAVITVLMVVINGDY